jgi:ParB family chromosome partitioning protein
MSVTAERRGLGRGLGELFQRTEPPEAKPVLRGVDVEEDSEPPQWALSDLIPPPGGSFFADVPIDSITPNPRQPRTNFDQEALEELVGSIQEVGLLQPIVVRPLPRDHGRDGPSYELVMGERRWRAAQQAGLATIPAIVRETEEHDLLRDALLENLHRAQLNPLEEAAAYAQMLEDFGCTQDELAVRIKRSRPQISNTIRLLRLPPTVQRRVAAGVLSAGHARALLAIADPAGQERLAQRVVAEGLSVRAVEELVTLGETGPEGRSVRRRGPAPVPPRATELAERLADRLETRVRVEPGKAKGRIIIDFASMDDLERIAQVVQGDSMSTNV